MLKRTCLGVFYVVAGTALTFVFANLLISLLGWNLVVFLISSSSKGGQLEFSRGRIVDVDPGRVFDIIFVKRGEFAEEGARFTCKTDIPGYWDLYMIGWTYKAAIITIEECKIASYRQIFFIP